MVSRRFRQQLWRETEADQATAGLRRHFLEKNRQQALNGESIWLSKKQWRELPAQRSTEANDVGARAQLDQSQEEASVEGGRALSRGKALSPGTTEDLPAEKGWLVVLDYRRRSKLMTETRMALSSLQNSSPRRLPHFTHSATS